MKNRKRIIEIILLCTFSIFVLIFAARSSTNISQNSELAAVKEPVQTTALSTPLTLNTPTVSPDLVRWPTPTFSPVLEDNSKAVDTANLLNKPPKRYLISNPIKVNENKLSQEKSTYKMELSYPQIDGILDLSVQNRINNDIKGYADSFQKEAELYQKDLKEIRMNYNVTANYNNILCINIYQHIILNDDYLMRQETLLYELVSGKKLELKDIFAENTDFPGILNRKIEQYILKNNLEEDILKSPFKGIRVGQGFELTENSLRILFTKNNEINTIGMIYGPDSFIFKLKEFNGLIDIYDKYLNPGKELYQATALKRKMIPNDFEEKFMRIEYMRDKYRAAVTGRMFSGMKNNEFEKKLNDICSYSGENEFKKLIPGNIEKSDDYNKMPYILRDYGILANYCDVLCLVCYEHYRIPEGASKDSQWHMSYNVLTGKKLELKDLFKNNFDWKTAIKNRVTTELSRRNLKLDANLDTAMNKADFWFDDETLWINLKPDEKIGDPMVSNNIFNFTFESLGEDNFIIRE